MSLINQMLQDLEKRGEEQGANSESVSQYAQYGSSPKERRLGFRFFVLVGLGLLLAYVVYAMVYQGEVNSKNASEVTKTKVEALTATPVTAAQNADAELLKTASLPLLLKMSTKIDAVVSNDSSMPENEKNKLAESSKSPNSQEPSRENVQLESSSKQVDLGGSTKPTTDFNVKLDPKQASANSDKLNAGQGAVIKEVSPQQRAEGEFKQATIYQQQGRNSEAILSLEQALKLDSNHAPARQLMISLLLEGKRYDDAIRELRAGLANDPHQINFAMILARWLNVRRSMKQ
jgi:MSHA biogenesis protein MshN